MTEQTATEQMPSFEELWEKEIESILNYRPEDNTADSATEETEEQPNSANNATAKQIEPDPEAVNLLKTALVEKAFDMLVSRYPQLNDADGRVRELTVAYIRNTFEPSQITSDLVSAIATMFYGQYQLKRKAYEEEVQRKQEQTKPKTPAPQSELEQLAKRLGITVEDLLEAWEEGQ